MSGEAAHILEKVDIVEVISKYVKLKKSGRNLVGLCPFHKERTPSFTVSPEKQIFYCFGCHEGGNAVHFLMKYERVSFSEALESLASAYGIPLRKGASSRKGLYEKALNRLCDFYTQCLSESYEALSYLRNRGIEETGIREFSLGYSDRKKDIKRYLKSTEIPMDAYMATGIVRIKGSELFDIFRGRIVIPIRDANSKIIGFGGRTIEEGAMPKYVNSPESPVFSKGSVLFGIDLTKKAIVERDEVFVVEGYFDLISLYLSGLTNVVATLGTSVTEEQLKRLRTLTENVNFMLDPDDAGLKSALRLIPLVSEMEINASIVILPKGYDPDSFVREKGYEALERILLEKKPILDYLFQHYSKKYDMREIQNRIGFIKSVMPYIEGVKDGVVRRLYLKKLSDLTGVEEEYFSSLLSRKDVTPGPGCHLRAIDKRVVGALVLRPSLIKHLEEKNMIGQIRDERVKRIVSHVSSLYKEESGLNVNRLILALEEEELRSLVLDSALEAEGQDTQELEKIVMDYVLYLERTSIKEEAEKITRRIKEAESRGDDEEVLRLLQRKKNMILRPK